MTFDQKMKKHGTEKLDELVPNPYPKTRRFPLWAKIAIPVGGVGLVTAVTLAALLPNLLVAPLGEGFFATPTKANKIQSLNTSYVERMSPKALESLDAYFADSSNENFVLSPASYQLAVSSLAAVSEGFDLASFGLIDAEADTKTLLESWNFLYENTDPEHSAYCRFDSGVLHQQVGGSYRFDKQKQEKVASDYIATSVASLRDYHKQATSYFRDAVGLTIDIPDPKPTADGVITYGALKMKDYVPGGMGSSEKPFHAKDKTISAPSRSFGSICYPAYLPYYQGEGYQAFQMKIENTSLLILLPDEETSLESISISNAYSSFMEHKQTHMAMGYVPYFHLHTEGEDLTSAIAKRLTGKEKFYDKLLADDVINNLSLSSVLQSSDFEFNRYGVSGESITVIQTAGSAAPEEHKVLELNVDRPFYAISLKDGFPLFVNKVNDPSR